MATQQAGESMAARWAAVSQVVMALGEELSIEGLIGRTLDQTLVVLGADAGGLYVVNAAERRLELMAERGLPPDLVDEIGTLPLDHFTTSLAR